MEAEKVITSIKEKNVDSLKLFSKLNYGRAFTLIELSNASKINQEEIQKYLDDLVKIDILKTRGNRQRIYYYLNNKKATASLNLPKEPNKEILPKGMKYCRHCYKHLAGYVGVQFTNALVENDFIIPVEIKYDLTDNGWEWFSSLGIEKDRFDENERLFTKQCLDFSERKSHLGGKLGDALLEMMLSKNWLKQIPASREISITKKGSQAFKQELDLVIK